MLKAGLVAGALVASAIAVPAIAADGGGSWPGDPDTPRTTVYDAKGAATLLTGNRRLACSGDNVYRQMIGGQAAYCTDDDRPRGSINGDFRSGRGVVNGGLHRGIAKLNGSALAKFETPGQMANAMKRAIDDGGDAAHSDQVAIDEIGNQFRDPKPVVEKRVLSCNGKVLGTFPSEFRLRCDRNGWKILRETIQPPAPPEESTGRDFSNAMAMLSRMDHKNGGTYADRVHVYLAPAFITSVANGRGAHFTQDRRGRKPVRAGWIGVAEGLALAGGVHIEMYRKPGLPVNALEFARGPQRVANYLENRFGGKRSRIHLALSKADAQPAGGGGLCGDLGPMACQVQLASRGANAEFFQNGLTLFRIDEQAGAFLAAYRATKI